MNYNELEKKGYRYAFQITSNRNNADNTYGNLLDKENIVQSSYNSFELTSVPNWLSDYPNDLLCYFFSEFKKSYKEYFIDRVFVSGSIPDIDFFKGEDDTINLAITTPCCRILVYSETEISKTYYCISLKEGTKLRNESDILPTKDKIRDFIENVVIRCLISH